VINQTAVMSLFLIKSGPPDSSDGPDLTCLSQTHDPYFEPVRPAQGSVFRTDPFSFLKPNIFYCFAKYTTVFHYYTIFSQKFIFSLFSFPLKIFFALY